MSQIIEPNKIFCIYCKKETNNEVGYHNTCKEMFTTYQGQALWATKHFKPKKLPPFEWCGFDIFPKMLTTWKKEYSKKFRLNVNKDSDSFLQFLASQYFPKIKYTFQPEEIKKINLFYPFFCELVQTYYYFSNYSFIEWFDSFLVRASPYYLHEIGKYSKIIKEFKKKYSKDFKKVYQQENFLYVTIDFISFDNKNTQYFIGAFDEEFTKYYFISTEYKKFMINLR